MKKHAWYLSIIIVLFFSSGCMVLLSPSRYDDIIGMPFTAPCADYLLGTDSLGRDLLVRLCVAILLSILVATLSVSCSIGIGTIYGSYAGYKRGKIQQWMTAVIDIMECIPDFLYAILLMVFFNSIFTSHSLGSIFGLFLAIAMTSWTQMARIIKNSTVALMSENYIVYAQLKKAGFWHIARKHLVPNLKQTILVTTLQRIPSAIFLESFLSFVGIGVQPPFPSLGRLIDEGLSNFRDHPILLFAPSAALVMIVLLFNLAGNSYMKEFALHE